MQTLAEIASYFIHLDGHLTTLIHQVGSYTYLIVFLIILGETGLVIAPLLPGDSLLFAAGALAGKGLLNIWQLVAILWVASVLGDSLNYAIGGFLGPRVFREKSRWLNKEHLEQTHKFFEKHGGKAIILARFLPIVRTCAPFVAGVGKMDYTWFLIYNVVGGFLWVCLFLFGGYFFGRIPAVQHNFSLVILVIVVVSVVPAVVAWLRHRMQKKARMAAQ
jgi:membrane-associated protein